MHLTIIICKIHDYFEMAFKKLSFDFNLLVHCIYAFFYYEFFGVLHHSVHTIITYSTFHDIERIVYTCGLFYLNVMVIILDCEVLENIGNYTQV